MMMTRRSFVTVSAAGLAGLPGLNALGAGEKKTPRLRVGICDWNLKAKGREALEKAARIGLDGVQISPQGPAETLSFVTKEEQAMYAKAVKDTGVQIASIGLNVTNGCPLATDPRGPAWLKQTVDAAAHFGCKATLIAFFGKGALKNKAGLDKAAIDAVVERLKEAAPYAKSKGVILGLENTLSAKENLAILDRIGSDSVQVYYDIANSTKSGYDVPAEIRMLKGRICEFHFKNTDGVLGESGVDCKPIVKAVNEIGYEGWIVLERAFGKDLEAYFKKNAAYVREQFQLTGKS